MNIYIDIIIPTLTSILISMVVLPRTMLSKFHNRFRFGVIKEDDRFTSRARFLGGSAFVPIILIVMGLNSLIAFRFDNGVANEPLAIQITKILQLATGMAMLFIVGMIDDVAGATTKWKVGVIFFAACLFPLSGLWINNLYGLLGIYHLPYWIGIPFTVLLIMYLTATISLTDGVEGMATGQCSISLVAVLALAFYAGSRLTAFLSCAALGFTLTFFVLNTMQRRNKGTFLGLSGSLPLGYMICFIILCVYKEKEWNHYGDGLALAAFCTMLMPAFDMLRVLKSRFTDRRELTMPDRNLLYHKLMRIGLNRFYIQMVILLVNVLFVVATGILLNKDVNITLLLVVDTLIFIVFHFVINLIIDRQTKAADGMEWEKTYGRDNWSEEEEEDNYLEFGLQGAARKILEDTESQKAKIALGVSRRMDDFAFIPDGMNTFERNAKRIIDFCASGIFLVVFSPLFLFCYILIKKEDGGPAIYKQERIGRFGRPFYIYKFRSMKLDAEKSGPQLSHANGNEDDRLTKAGRFLRAHHLDELPQLWNVFCGQMAFIGYRPERRFFIRQIVEHDPRYYMLYQIRPGVTSYATLYNGYTDTMEKMLTRLELDLYYLKHRSWWFDAKILFLTFWHIIGGKRF